MNRAPDWLYDISIVQFEHILKKLPPPEIIRIPINDNLNKEHKGLISFVQVFDECCRYLETLPSQSFYAGYYVGQLMLYDSQQQTWPKGIELRAQRNYMSFVREYHLFIMLRKAFPDYEIIFDSEFDSSGIDFVISKNNENLIGICSYLGTKNSFQNLHHKRIKTNDLLLIELPLYPQQSRRVNQYWLYDFKEHVIPLKEKLNRMIGGECR